MSPGPLPLLALVACTDPTPPSPEPADLLADGQRLVLGDDGTVDLFDAEGLPVLLGGRAEAKVDGELYASDDDRPREIYEIEVEDGPKTARRLVVVVGGDGEGPDLRWFLTGWDDGHYTFSLDVLNHTGEAVLVQSTRALEVDATRGGGLFLGPDPATHRIMENGAHAALEFLTEVLPGDTPFNEAYATLSPGDYEGHSVSDGNHAVIDLASDATWVAGALSFDKTLAVTEISFNPVIAETSDDGRLGFSYLALGGDLLPQGKPLPDGESLQTETFYIHAAEPDALIGLEHWASALARHQGIVPWTRRNGGQRVPNGWNSWSGSGSTGGYGTDINEEVILANLDVMKTELRDWGIDWFQVDDGYQLLYGDWTWSSERFPHGPAWLSQQIRDAGFRPGLWMAPFTLDRDAPLVSEHPDWMADKTALGQAVVGSQEILDLTHPEVQGWLTELFTTFNQDWGFEWLKLDFGYLALFGDGFHDPSLTREEAWRAGTRAVREGMGPDSFFLSVGVLGPNYDLVDSIRTTLDNQPVWDQEPGIAQDDHLNAQGVKPTVRVAGRRWYLQDRVWVNHPDLLLFRSNTSDESWPRVSFEEARSFASFVGLSGGIVKLGDRLVDLDGEAIDVVRRLIPTFPTAARPRDAFTREFPEVWHMPVEAGLDGYDEAWDVVGLFHWGLNIDMSVNPYVEIPDTNEDRHHEVDLPALGIDGPVLAYEFWTGQFLGVLDGTLSLDVPSHDSRVVALRPVTGDPQFLGWNRQISMGATLLEDASWDGRQLHVATPVVPGTELAPFTWELSFYLPDGAQGATVEPSGVALDWLESEADGEVLTVRFEPSTAGELDLSIVP